MVIEVLPVYCSTEYYLYTVVQSITCIL